MSSRKDILRTFQQESSKVNGSFRAHSALTYFPEGAPEPVEPRPSRSSLPGYVTLPSGVTVRRKAR